MPEKELHLVEDDLAETFIEDWADQGVRDIETFLAKHKAFFDFLSASDELDLKG